MIQLIGGGTIISLFCLSVLLAWNLYLTRKAIREHRDARGDDRCWLDDMALYNVLPEAGNKRSTLFKDLALPPKCIFLNNCTRYFESRQLANPYRELSTLPKPEFMVECSKWWDQQNPGQIQPELKASAEKLDYYTDFTTGETHIVKKDENCTNDL